MKKISIVALFVAIGCHKKVENTPFQSQEPSTLSVQEFSLPEVIQNCSCQFATSHQAYNEGKLVYADDYGNTAYLNIEGKQVEIPMEEGDFDPQDFSKIIENEAYTVQIKTQRTADDVENMRYSGTMEILEKQTQKRATLPIWGECGCK